MIIFRPARATDLAQIYDVFYEHEVSNLADPPPPPAVVPSELPHILQTGTVYVAERGGHIIAFAAAITRSNIVYLTDLFVRPREQSSQLGKTLLQHVMPQNELVCCTMSSTDPRALSLYIRAGMRPQWPHFCLHLSGPLRNELPAMDVEIVIGNAGDPQFVQWEAQVGGRWRPEDLAYWVRERRAVPLWFQRKGVTIGYGYVHMDAGSLWYPEACRVGPIGARTAEDAAACVLAAVRWAHEQVPVLLINIPGPHPSLAPLLSAGFRIIYVETFVSTADTPFFDASRYISAGSNLL